MLKQPTIKLTKEMVDVISTDGLESAEFQQFLAYCGEAFLLLRK
jgi:hypothetical protein